MARRLTTVKIKETIFEVDAFKEVLRQKDSPDNRIPFQVFDQEGDGYRLLYDSEGRNVPSSKKAVLEAPERYCWVIIPALMELDPEGIALRYDIPLEILCPEGINNLPQEITAVVKPLKISEKGKKKND